jgi:hypothetical protein
VSGRLSRRRLLAGIVLVVAAGIVAFFLLRGGDDSGGEGGEVDSTPPATGRPEAANLDRLRSVADVVGHPVYWAGQQSGRRYELTVEHDGKVYVRYLPQGVRVGSRKVGSLTIGTYPYIGALDALRALARQPGAISDHTPDGGLVVTTGTSPDNVYVAYPEQDLQIEVYDPHAGSALALARGGAIVPIG